MEGKILVELEKMERYLRSLINIEASMKKLLNQNQLLVDKQERILSLYDKAVADYSDITKKAKVIR